MMARRLMVILAVLLMMVSSVGQAAAQPAADLQGIKTYLLDKMKDLKTNADALALAADTYYELVSAATFDYAVAWRDQRDAVTKALTETKAAWMTASPLYEQVEGIVAGVPVLSEFDVILDAGSAAADDPASAVPFDLTLPDGRVLEKPGNLFGILESTLWGTRAEFVGQKDTDLNGDGQLTFGEVLPEANVLKAAAALMATYVQDLQTAATNWEPNVTDAFTALVVMVPTMSEYFESWKQSRFVTGEASTQSDFNVISRLADIQDILGGLLVVYEGLSPLVKSVDPARDLQIATGLTDLRDYVVDLLKQEQEGKRFTRDEADLFGSEAQSRAESTAGQITQVAALLNVTLPQ
jgi:hypothetical protein